MIAEESRDPDKACSLCVGESERQPSGCLALVTTQGSLSIFLIFATLGDL